MIPIEIKSCGNCNKYPCVIAGIPDCVNFNEWEPNYQVLKERLEHIIKSTEWRMNVWKSDETYYLKCSIVDIWKIVRGEEL
jgi:hypothetical protein